MVSASFPAVTAHSERPKKKAAGLTTCRRFLMTHQPQRPQQSAFNPHNRRRDDLRARYPAGLPLLYGVKSGSIIRNRNTACLPPEAPL
jgi:hypothetical protein